MNVIKETVRSKYADIARSVTAGRAKSCCSADPERSEGFPSSAGGPSPCCAGSGSGNPITTDLYGTETAGLPQEALLASLGCGNPTLLAQLHEGETVLDLGSGGGIDVLLSARRVGPTGKAYGLDMTGEMLALANENKRKAGVENVEFLEGEIESIPLPDAAVDVIISNCVINLSVDKRRVLAEAFRVLKPGGRFAVSDVVKRAEVEFDVELWAGCIAGALHEDEYRRLLAEVGFEAVDVEPTRIYEEHGGTLMSAFVRARKPA
jgi:SAM-dependent methyltransferase